MDWKVSVDFEKICGRPEMTTKSCPRGEQVSPSFCQVIDKITQSHRFSGDWVSLRCLFCYQSFCGTAISRCQRFEPRSGSLVFVGAV